MIFPLLVQYLTGNYYKSAEWQAFGMAFQGALALRNGRNKDLTMSSFHAFALSTVIAFGGGWMGFIWLGKPTSMITGGDVTWPVLIFSFMLSHCTPSDIGCKLGNFLPVTMAVTSLAQLFRSLGMIKFITTAFMELKDNPSPYYPTPIIGPVLYGTMLGNMGSFMVKGFDGHLEKGMPWPFQNALTMGTLFHLYVHDEDGIGGQYLRSIVHFYLGEEPLGLDDRTFAVVFVSLFMQVTGILQLPAFYGPSFSPYTSLYEALASVTKKQEVFDDDLVKKDRSISAPKVTMASTNGGSNGVVAAEPATETAAKKKRNRKKNSKAKTS